MRSKVAAGCVALALTATGLSPSAAQADTAPDWLQRLNEIRVANGLEPATENVEWNAGIAAHLRYLRLTPAEYRTGEYANAHTENPASPYYSADGDEAGRSSNLGGGTDELDALNGWLAAPFHAIGSLRPGLRQVALYRNSDGRAGQDVIRGLEGGVVSPDPVLFPGPGTRTDLASFQGEAPDPLEPCGFQSAGLPLIALLPQAPVPGLRAEMVSPDGSTSRGPGPSLCVITADTWRSSDDVYGPTGESILRSANAVLVIPPRTLQAGRHSVRLVQDGRADVTWSFTRVAPPTLTTRPSVVRFGQTAVVTVRGTPGATVDLYARKYRGELLKIRDGLVLGPDGQTSLDTRPDVNLRFQAKDRDIAQASSIGGADGLMRVEKRVSLTTSRVGVGRYTVSGSISPTHPGATVSLYRDGRLVRSGTAVDGAGTYALTLSLPRGTHDVEVRSPATGYNDASTSPARTIRTS